MPQNIEKARNTFLSCLKSKVLKMKKRELLQLVLDCFFLLVIAIVCFGTQIRLTTFYFNLFSKMYKLLYLMTCIAALVKVGIAIAEVLGNTGKIKEKL